MMDNLKIVLVDGLATAQVRGGDLSNVCDSDVANVMKGAS
jgi:hypothetical protein